MKYRISLLLITSFLFIGFSSGVYAQATLNLPTSSVLQLQQYDARVLSLGQTTSALGNRSGYSSNPAVPYSDSLVHVSGYVPKPYALSFFEVDWTTQSFGAAYQYKRHSFSISHDLIDFDFNLDNYHNSLSRIQYGTKLAPNFYIGAGVSISSIEQKFTRTTGYDEQYQPLNETNTFSYSNFGISAGLYHRATYSIREFYIDQEIGLVLSDLGGENNLEPNNSDSFEASHPGYLPTTMRLSVGWNAASNKRLFGKTLLGAGLYLGAIKYFSRTFDQESGFDSIFNNWGSFTYFNGQETITVSAAEQISNNIGLEITLLEGLSFRYGIQGGSNSSEINENSSSFQGFTNADYFVRRQRGFGVGLDLQYISFSYTKVSFIKTDRWIQGDDLVFFQTTLRIPLYREKALFMKDFFKI